LSIKKCYCCQSNSHYWNECVYLQHSVASGKLKYLSKSGIVEKREAEFKRNEKRKKFKTFLEAEEVRELVEDFQDFN
jgi:hypothetical protein